MKGRRWLIAALVAVLVGAFGVQASSTWLLGEHQHMEAGVRPFLILLLEVGSITGAALYLATRNKGTRRRAGLLVAIAVGVGATGGVMRYGFLIGLPVAAVLLLMVDIIGRSWHEEEPAAAPAVAPVTLRLRVPDVPANVPTVREPAPPMDPPSTPTPPTERHAVPRKRNRDQLEAAGKALPDDLRVVRKTGESVDRLRERVERNEREAAARRTVHAFPR